MGGDGRKIWRMTTFSGHDIVQDPAQIGGYPRVNGRESIATHPRSEWNDADGVDSFISGAIWWIGHNNWSSRITVTTISNSVFSSAGASQTKLEWLGDGDRSRMGVGVDLGAGRRVNPSQTSTLQRFSKLNYKKGRTNDEYYEPQMMWDNVNHESAEWPT